MKLITFAAGSGPRTGAVEGDIVIDLAAADPRLPAAMPALLAAGPEALAAAARVAAAGSHAVPLASVTLLAPVPRPGKVLAIGMNYADHLKEMGRERPPHQVWFNKQPGAIIGPGAGIEKPAQSDELDYEAELVMVIGRRCRRVPRERWLEAVAGFTIGNDVTVRDWQRRAPTMTMGKGWDTHGPTGPWIVTADDLPDPQSLKITAHVNGEERQNASTAEMIFSLADQIAELSTAFTLEPGDLIFTGTPAGVGAGHKPPRYLSVGDTVRITIEGIGSLENPVIAAPAGMVLT